MPVLSARGLSKAYGPQTLLSDASITIVRGERVGLLGVNGTGKSTLLRILAGKEPADTGTIDRRRDATVIFLEQEPVLDPDKTPREIVEEGLADWKAATSRYAELTHLIAGSPSEELVREQSLVGERIEQLGGWARSHIASDMLGKLGVLDVDRPVGTMSGGERRRVALAHVLVARPTLAVLDEPTNHLDADTIDWLETYLKTEHTGAVLLVTHDRYVLDTVCDRILELDRGALQSYRGGYSDFLEEKAERLAHEERVEQNRMNFVRRERVWLMRQPKARSTKQKARIDRAETAIALVPQRPPDAIDLVGLERGAADLGRSILDIEGLGVTLAGRELVSNFDIHLVVGDRIGVVGPNGAGKTSLLRVVTGELAPTKGRVVLGQRTKVALFDQGRAELEDDWSILDNVAEREGASRTGAGVVTFGKETMELRSYLELFLFDGAKQRQSVGSLSGGERARVALAKILKGGANLLLLDEPTNDLDVATLSSLEELLTTWPGCVIAVSHDRYFLDRVATSIVAFEGAGSLVRYPGGYTSYVSRRRAQVDVATARAAPRAAPRAAAAAPSAAPDAPPPAKPLTYGERIELDKMMDVIAAAEARVIELEGELSDPGRYATKRLDGKAMAEALAAAQTEVSRLVERWENLESRRGAKK
ncbi:MAG TPA: ABC-F family ATP-binding cassette domain-containing protein [Polyangiaceae bacterium]